MVCVCGVCVCLVEEIGVQKVAIAPFFDGGNYA